ncbi:hypothetical protein MNB_SUP05-SYMBIONT-4-280 [hydrothermal vent metagenome]|uniref:Uncharacterized protein n=1 Tax=hydrothermal vent metagenome TaxID=652676 RepID=A0A1W1DZR2_9ZZZZ
MIAKTSSWDFQETGEGCGKVKNVILTLRNIIKSSILMNGICY